MKSLSYVIIGLGLIIVYFSLCEEKYLIEYSCADTCNYSIIKANPNPCEFDLDKMIKCSVSMPCKDGIIDELAVFDPCGGSVVFGTNAVLMQPNPNGGTDKSKEVPDIKCGTRIPCVVSICIRGTCLDGVATLDNTGDCTTYARECCEGNINDATPINVHQAASEACNEG